VSEAGDLDDKVALVVGAGDALGGAIARRFARGGFTVCVARRSGRALEPLRRQIEGDGGSAHAFAVDARKEDQVIALFDTIEGSIGALEVVVFNIGAWFNESVLTMTVRKFTKVWEMACFAGAKFGLRALAQSMARELGPKGLHVAHVVIDGPIDTRFVRERFPEMVAALPEHGLAAPDDIAENFYMLHEQPRSAWSHELDLRPWAEKW
jgi:NAD(P)-dependent dehydrogenase (short-subunit alcohol dehydrogenase family)